MEKNISIELIINTVIVLTLVTLTIFLSMKFLYITLVALGFYTLTYLTRGIPAIENYLNSTGNELSELSKPLPEHVAK